MGFYQFINNINWVFSNTFTFGIQLRANYNNLQWVCFAYIISRYECINEYQLLLLRKNY